MPCRIREGSLFLIQMKHAVVLTLMLGLAGCGGAVKKPVAAPKLVITPGMKAAQQALDAGTYALATRLYAAQVEGGVIGAHPQLGAAFVSLQSTGTCA